MGHARYVPRAQPERDKDIERDHQNTGRRRIVMFDTWLSISGNLRVDQSLALRFLADLYSFRSTLLHSQL